MTTVQEKTLARLRKAQDEVLRGECLVAGASFNISVGGWEKGRYVDAWACLPDPTRESGFRASGTMCSVAEFTTEEEAEKMLAALGEFINHKI